MSNIVPKDISIRIGPKLKTSLEYLQKIRLKAIKYKLIIDCVQESIKGSMYELELNKKLKRFLMVALTKNNYIKNSTEDEIEYFLGLKFDEIDFTLYEKKEIVAKVGKVLNEKHKMFFNELIEIFGEPKESFFIKANDETWNAVLVDFYKQLNEQREDMTKYLSETYKLLEEIIEIRTKEFPSLVNDAVVESEKIAKMQQLKTNILSMQINIEALTITNETREMYQVLLKDILEEQDECRIEIRRLKELKEKYNQVNSEEFRAILKQYTHYRRLKNMKSNLGI